MLKIIAHFSTSLRIIERKIKDLIILIKDLESNIEINYTRS